MPVLPGYGWSVGVLPQKGPLRSEIRGWRFTSRGSEDGRVLNPDIAGLANTIPKMAKKRAHIDALLNTIGASQFFTQDIEDRPVAGFARAQSNSRRPCAPPTPEQPARPWRMVNVALS